MCSSDLDAALAGHQGVSSVTGAAPAGHKGISFFLGLWAVDRPFCLGGSVSDRPPGAARVPCHPFLLRVVWTAFVFLLVYLCGGWGGGNANKAKGHHRVLSHKALGQARTQTTDLEEANIQMEGWLDCGQGRCPSRVCVFGIVGGPNWGSPQWSKTSGTQWILTVPTRLGPLVSQGFSGGSGRRWVGWRIPVSGAFRAQHAAGNQRASQ